MDIVVKIVLGAAFIGMALSAPYARSSFRLPSNPSRLRLAYIRYLVASASYVVSFFLTSIVAAWLLAPWLSTLDGRVTIQLRQFFGLLAPLPIAAMLYGFFMYVAARR